MSIGASIDLRVHDGNGGAEAEHSVSSLVGQRHLQFGGDSIEDCVDVVFQGDGLGGTSDHGASGIDDVASVGNEVGQGQSKAEGGRNPGGQAGGTGGSDSLSSHAQHGPVEDSAARLVAAVDGDPGGERRGSRIGTRGDRDGGQSQGRDESQDKSELEHFGMFV